MKKILMLATGGTIASKRTPEGLAPLLSSEELLQFVPDTEDFCRVDTLQLLNLDSTNIAPKHWLLMARAIEEHYGEYDGFVLCHGTDTMAYTAAALSYLIQRSPKPIVVTGAQRPIDLELTDAKQNLSDSFRYASHPGACGVQIVFDGKVIPGTRAKKTRTKSYNAFSSIGYPYPALIRDGKVIQYFNNEPWDGPEFFRKLDGRVGLFKLVPGVNADFLEYLLSQNDAVIIESYGVGGLPEGPDARFFDVVDASVSQGKVIVMTTQVQQEGSDMGVYQVGQRFKRLHGMLETYDMTLEAAVTKLMWILGQTQDKSEVARLFYTPVSHDLTLLNGEG